MKLEELDLLTTEEVMALLQAKRDAVLRLVHTGQLGAVRISRKCFRFHRGEVERFVREGGEVK